MNLEDLQSLVTGGESETLEFKKTTGQLARAGKTLCGFLNRRGGILLFGVAPDHHIAGQIVADTTLRDIAALLQLFEPQPPISIHRVPLPQSNLEVISIQADLRADLIPFTYEGRAYERVGTTTSAMSQQRYQELLVNRLHSRSRWENQRAEDFKLADLDEEEIRRTARLGISSGRMPETTDDVTEVLDRLGLRVDGCLLNAAVVVYGKHLLPQFTQCELRMARFRGVDKTEFMDQRQLHGHAFTLLEEAILFLRRHLPTAGRIQPGLFERADEPLFPFEALREALVNAFCHRVYSTPGSAVSLAAWPSMTIGWRSGATAACRSASRSRISGASTCRGPGIP